MQFHKFHCQVENLKMRFLFNRLPYGLTSDDSATTRSNILWWHIIFTLKTLHTMPWSTLAAEDQFRTMALTPKFVQKSGFFPSRERERFDASLQNPWRLGSLGSAWWDGWESGESIAVFFSARFHWLRSTPEIDKWSKWTFTAVVDYLTFICPKNISSLSIIYSKNSLTDLLKLSP